MCVCMYMMEYYWAIKKSGMLPFATKDWARKYNAKCSKSEKDTVWFHSCRIQETTKGKKNKVKSIKRLLTTESKWIVTRGEVEEGWVKKKNRWGLRNALNHLYFKSCSSTTKRHIGCSKTFKPFRFGALAQE